MQGNGFQDLHFLSMIAGLGSYNMEYKESIEGASKSFGNFFSSIVRLRTPGGCPWDLEQTALSMRGDLLEECFEAIEAINEENPEHVKEELGDLLLNLLVIAFIHEQEKQFTLSELIDAVNEKIIRRHPHVFEESEGKSYEKDGGAKTSEEVLAQWDSIKQGLEGRKKESILDEVSLGLPPLMRAFKLQKKAAKKGFDWKNPEGVREKVEEELLELIEAKNADEREDEAGDLLFVTVNYIRHLGVDPSIALSRANAKFYKRFGHVERRMAETEGKSFTAEELDGFWREAKDMDDKDRLEYT